MAMAPTMAQNTVYAGHQSDLSVIPVLGDTYLWELYYDNTNINFAVTNSNCPVADAYIIGVNTTPAISVMWVNPGIYYYKVTAFRGSCVMNLKIGQMIVLDSLPTAVILPHDPICAGTPTNLTVQLTGAAPWSITYTTNGANPVTINNIGSSPYLLDVGSPTVTTIYQIISVTNAVGTNSVPSDPVTLTVNPVPTVSPIYHN
jgi:hypothetical protein